MKKNLKDIYYYLAIWVLLNGFSVSLMYIVYATIAFLITLIICRRIEFTEIEDKHSIKYYFDIAKYSLWLGKEILFSALNITKKIWESDAIVDKKDIFIKVPLKQENERRQVLFANSITLTPGTISVDIEENSAFIIVNTFDDKITKDMKKQTFDKSINLIDSNHYKKSKHKHKFKKIWK